MVYLSRSGVRVSQVSEPSSPRSLTRQRASLLPDGAGRWALGGGLTVRTLSDVLEQLDALDGPEVALDLAELRTLDTAGAYLLVQLDERLRAQGGSLRLSGQSPDHQAVLERVAESMPKPETDAVVKLSLMGWFDQLGRKVVAALDGFTQVLAMLGLFLAKLVYLLRHPSEFRTTALVHHCHQVGWKAVPIVALMGFLIGVVLAFQGSVQLRQFGAEIFVVDLIAISILRELGILLTAIIVAGRTASSFTAAIGSMKMREEIDAMRTLAIDPAVALFVPRILALLIVLPILGMIANVMGLFGGAMMAWIELGISPGMFVSRLLDDTSLDHVIVGFVKAPVFALIIGVIGCHAGMQVGGNAESLGTQTSSAVVRAIFMVIVADALFSVFFAILGI
ncbi:MAG: MlaE family lipid ABC transporter permease subunit [Rhodobacteraceae bacterium]|nr:MAG: MlaE family lipid ABC transporter permease subunit [Paracoccaceae bacterium]